MRTIKSTQVPQLDPTSGFLMDSARSIQEPARNEGISINLAKDSIPIGIVSELVLTIQAVRLVPLLYQRRAFARIYNGLSPDRLMTGRT